MKQIVTMQSLSGRIRRALEKIGLKLIKNSPTNRLAQGDYTLVNFNAKSLSKNNLYNFISEGEWCSSIHHENLPSGFGLFRAPYRSPEFLLDKR